jgi:hypothetical protein
MLALTKASEVAALMINTGCIIMKGDKR